MAGHSKWANIKHRKSRQDAKRGKQWSKCSRAIIVAARNGGGDPKFNTTLRYAIDDAKAVNMPKDTIEKAIKKGDGGADGEQYEEVRYEGYGPGGVAVLIDCLIANVNKAAAEIRSIFDKNNGKMGVQGSVAFGFTQQGVFLIEHGRIDEDRLMEVALEAGADDVTSDPDGGWQVTCDPSSFHGVKDALEGAEIELASAEVTNTPQTMVDCNTKIGVQILRLVDALEDLDDVQKVYTNAEIPAEAYEQL
ncbi:MAG: YebC/PmpR family DNA-binding transcriptional regulator [Phycisphaerae bacterium]|nr:YebC/PmpR family DNA-binding transcriptional regulator [Phycisphaerae bacterium]